jgi:phage FluMu protein Com
MTGWTSGYRRVDSSIATMRCARCGEVKPTTEFRLLPHGSFASYCHECQRQATRDWRTLNRDVILARRRAAYTHVAHPELRCAICGQTFTARTSMSRYCSVACRRRRKVDRNRESRAERARQDTRRPVLEQKV